MRVTRFTRQALLRTIGVHIVLASQLVACAAAGRPAEMSTAAETALVIPFQLLGNQVFVEVSVDGARPLTFILDTGAPRNTVDLRQARSFGLPLQSLGTMRAGVGANDSDVYVVAREVTLRLGDASLASQVLFAIPLDLPPECRVPAAGRADSAAGVSGVLSGHMEGILGGPLFHRFVVDIDYAARRITLHEPSGYRYAGRGEIVPIRMAGEMPVLDARVTTATRRSATVRLGVDLGAASVITINRQFADSHQIVPPPAALSATNECGLGGAAAGTSFEGPLDTVRIGRVTLSNPMTFFRRNPVGQGFDGLLGGGALRNFRVIFDYSRRRMILERPSTPAR